MVKTCFLIALTALLAAGCNKSNPNFCPGNPDNNCIENDGGSDGAGACGSNADCTSAGKLVCDTTETPHACVECTTGDHSACTSTTPVCTDDACGACTMHSQCDSDVCLPDGSCSDAGNVAYVDPAGTDNDACSKATPCTKVAKALGTNMPYIKMTGSTDEQVSINNQTVTILADPGAQLTSTTNGVLLQVMGSASVTIYDLEITAASGIAQGIGISIAAGGTQTVDLERVKVTSCQNTGVAGSGGTLRISQSTIALNGAGGIDLTAPTTFTITNNFIYRNGNSSTSSVGGASLMPAGTSSFEFNTVVDNLVKSGGALAGGVACDETGFAAPNNIISRNEVNGMAGAVNANTNSILLCTFPTAVVATDLTSLALKSPDTSPYDYHLTTASTPAIDQATADATVKVDVDGDTRPQGAGYDIGADELKQP